jgi:hypothetical protein
MEKILSENMGGYSASINWLLCSIDPKRDFVLLSARPASGSNK